MFGDERGIYLLAYDPGETRAYPVDPCSVWRLIVTLDRAPSNSVETTIHCWADSRTTYERRPSRMADQESMCCGRLPKVTWTFMVCEPLRIFKVTC